MFVTWPVRAPAAALRWTAGGALVTALATLAPTGWRTTPVGAARPVGAVVMPSPAAGAGPISPPSPVIAASAGVTPRPVGTASTVVTPRPVIVAEPILMAHRALEAPVVRVTGSWQDPAVRLTVGVPPGALVRPVPVVAGDVAALPGMRSAEPRPIGARMLFGRFTGAVVWLPGRFSVVAILRTSTRAATRRAASDGISSATGVAPVVVPGLLGTAPALLPRPVRTSVHASTAVLATATVVAGPAPVTARTVPGALAAGGRPEPSAAFIPAATRPASITTARISTALLASRSGPAGARYRSTAIRATPLGGRRSAPAGSSPAAADPSGVLASGAATLWRPTALAPRVSTATSPLVFPPALRPIGLVSTFPGTVALVAPRTVIAGTIRDTHTTTVQSGPPPAAGAHSRT